MFQFHNEFPSPPTGNSCYCLASHELEVALLTMVGFDVQSGGWQRGTYYVLVLADRHWRGTGHDFQTQYSINMIKLHCSPAWWCYTCFSVNHDAVKCNLFITVVGNTVFTFSDTQIMGGLYPLKRHGKKLLFKILIISSTKVLPPKVFAQSYSHFSAWTDQHNKG